MKGGCKLRNQKLDLCNFVKIGTCICTETAFYQFWWLTAVRPPVTMQPPNKSLVYVEEGSLMKKLMTREQLAQLPIEKLMVIAEIVEAMLDSQQAAPDSGALAEIPQRECGR